MAFCSSSTISASGCTSFRSICTGGTRPAAEERAAAQPTTMIQAVKQPSNAEIKSTMEPSDGQPRDYAIK
eukprot:2844296-Pleurochrysis_carterae.AAC.1